MIKRKGRSSLLLGVIHIILLHVLPHYPGGKPGDVQAGAELVLKPHSGHISRQGQVILQLGEMLYNCGWGFLQMASYVI